jgi:AAA family ATP:ADP antiporter
MGEYLLGEYVVEAAMAAVEAGEAVDMGSFIGSFYAGFFMWVNIAAVVLQALLVSRLVRWFGIGGVVYALPLVALGAWGAVALGAGFAVTRVLKSAENATDYSVMNTAKAMLWLPLSRAEKYKAKQAVDTFFVRLGDVLAAAVVAVGLSTLGLGVRGFATVNVVVVFVWFAVAVVLTRRYLAVSGARGGLGES